MLTLEKRLNNEIKKNPSLYTDENITRISEFIKYVNTYPEKRKPYRIFKEIIDYQLFVRMFPELEGMSTSDMQKDMIIGRSIYNGVNYWTDKIANGKKQLKKEFMIQILPQVTLGWTDYNTQKKWVKYFKTNPVWEGKNSSQMHKDKELDGIKAFSAYVLWTIRESKGDKKYQKRLLYEIFPRKKIDWTEFTDVYIWKIQHDITSGWIGKSPTDIRKDKDNHGHEFCSSSFKWTAKKAKGDQEYRIRLLKIIYGEQYAFHEPHRRKTANQEYQTNNIQV